MQDDASNQRSASEVVSGSTGPLWPTYDLTAAIMRLTVTSGGHGTGFQIRHDDKDYLVTAAHGMPDGEDRVEFLISRHSGLGSQHVTLQRVDELDDDNPGDVAIFSLPPQPHYLSSEMLTTSGIGLGQDVMVIGYPFGQAFPVSIGGKSYSTQMVKRGGLAAIGEDEMFLDLVANPGFSGAPVFFYEPREKKTLIAGMIKETGTLAATDGTGGIPSAYADISVGSWSGAIVKRLKISL